MLGALPGFAQTYPVSGRVVDITDQSPLIGANVLLVRLPDSAKTGTAVDPTGSFSIPAAPGRYVLTTSFLGYVTLRRPVEVTNGPVALGSLTLATSQVKLKGVEVVGQAAAAVQKGDTTQFDSRAFKTNPDANAQDLITKMPGVVVQDGKVQAQGEQVQRITVDGKEFFGSDPDAVLKNLPAEAIDKIQVFDRRSDQSQFTGFNDGNTEKTINIVTKPNFRNGQFGRIVAGYGPSSTNSLADGKYQVSGNLNSFKGTRRFSVVAQSNNVNQQNFGTDDLLGVIGTSAQGGGGARGGQGGARGGQGGNRGGGQGQQGGSNAGNFLVNQASGISTTHAVGLNFSDTWGKKVDVQASYFFNLSDNNSNSTTNRLYNVRDSAFYSPYSRQSPLLRTLGYNEISEGSARNINNRFNLRLDYKIDSTNSILWQPRFTMQRNSSDSNLDGNTFLSGFSDVPDSVQSANLSRYNSAQDGITFTNQLLYRHRFAKRGRTFSLGLNTTYNDRDADNYLYSDNFDYTSRPDIRLSQTNQYSRLDQVGWTWNGSANYTEPISLKSQLQLNYTLNYSPNDSDKKTYNLLNGEQQVLDEQLSNVFTSRYITNSGGLTYRYQFEKLEWAVGTSVQYAQLHNEQEFPQTVTTDRPFWSVLPNASVQYKFSRNQNLRLNYQTRTQNPSINQLQAVVNNSNQLQIRTGNPDLAQEYSHNLFLRYSSSQPETSRSFFALIGGSYTDNSIANSTTVVQRPTAIDGTGVIVPAGGTIIRPVNLNNQYSLRSFANYTLPLKVIKSNLNLNASASFSQTPGFVNGVLNYNRSPNFGLGAVLSSNISPELDFTLSSNSTQTYARNTVQSNSNSQYFRQNTTLRLNWILLKGVTLQSEVNHVALSGLTAGYNQNFVLWNASLGKKLFAKQQAEIRLYAFDLLAQNNSIQRNITDAYTEDVRTNILQRYFMVMFTYNLRNFSGSGAAPTDAPATETGSLAPRRHSRRPSARRWRRARQRVWRLRAFHFFG
ncbi:outer membrane beta-barrel protein [Hymenobacter cellulosilyticus]|uniref:Outer membrane beta-barrel protein n=1 Tax=Hymenobacter cellulosilyticus TaxID=2932248 RepID=A0A8T9Q9M5_9BACT|nr:outer membrane beta-barrel protein [Hymenobacter cellulosilyticus]UOQ72209.1 outer membrane beta-barrel protein [Hymenobacter cellulosilyticus]